VAGLWKRARQRLCDQARAGGVAGGVVVDSVVDEPAVLYDGRPVEDMHVGVLVAGVRVRLKAGSEPEILGIVTAYECGTIVNPDNVRRQIEGATVMGLGAALFEAVHFDQGRITNASLSDYRVPRFTDAPPIDVVLLDRPDIPSAGAGETPIIAVAPALANALVAAGLPRSRRFRCCTHARQRPVAEARQSAGAVTSRSGAGVVGVRSDGQHGAGCDVEEAVRHATEE
jgi:CO/xanthine dehydrogenase Mo-binding subunit